MKLFTQVVLLVLIACANFNRVAMGENWPQFRGPDRDGISRETGWLTKWPEGGLKILWKVPVGRGYSSVAVAGGRLFTLGLLPKDKDPAKKDPLEETLSCLNAETGESVWRFAFAGAWNRQFPGARSTPTIDGKVVYVYGQYGELVCLEAETGKVVWQKSMVKDLGAKNVVYGYAASPLIVDDLVIVPARVLIDKSAKDSEAKPAASALLVAFNKQKGHEVWRAYHPSPELGGGYWASPVACVMHGKRRLVYSSGNACLGLEPATGKVLWKHPFSDDDLLRKKGHNGITAQEPVVLGNRVICCIHPDNSNGLGVCLEVDNSEMVEVKEVWRDKLLDNYTCCNIVWKGHVFGITHNDTASRVGPLYCFDVQTGQKKWEQMGSGGSFTMADGKFLAFTGEQLVLIEASTDAYKELARSQKLFLPAEVSYRYSDRIAPVLSNGRIYCRSQSGILVCVDVRGK